LIGSAGCFVAAFVCSIFAGSHEHVVNTPVFGKNPDLVSTSDSNRLSTSDKNIAWNFGALQAAVRIMPGHLTQEH
jgi:hypothetical protein